MGLPEKTSCTYGMSFFARSSTRVMTALAADLPRRPCEITEMCGFDNPVLITRCITPSRHGIDTEVKDGQSMPLACFIMGTTLDPPPPTLQFVLPVARCHNHVQFALAHLESRNSNLHFEQTHADVQVVAGLMYTLMYSGNDGNGVCQVRIAKLGVWTFVRSCFVFFAGVITDTKKKKEEFIYDYNNYFYTQ